MPLGFRGARLWCGRRWDHEGRREGERVENVGGERAGGMIKERDFLVQRVPYFW
jgi:hypothetical protein